MKSFYNFVILAVLLSGCAGKKPTENIIDHHLQLVDVAIKDKDMSDKAKEALKTCQAGLLSAKESFKVEIAKCESDIRYWKAVSAFLEILIALYLGFKIMKR